MEHPHHNCCMNSHPNSLQRDFYMFGRQSMEDGNEQIHRVPSQSSLASSTFTVDSLRATLEDCSRHPVQHPLGNEGMPENSEPQAGCDQQTSNYQPSSSHTSQNLSRQMHSGCSHLSNRFPVEDFRPNVNETESFCVDYVSSDGSFMSGPNMRRNIPPDIQSYSAQIQQPRPNLYKHSNSHPPSQCNHNVQPNMGRSLSALDACRHQASSSGYQDPAYSNPYHMPQSMNDRSSTNIGLEHSLTGISGPPFQQQSPTQSQPTEVSYEKQISTSSTGTEDCYSFETQYPSLHVEDQEPSLSRQKPVMRKQAVSPSHNQNVTTTSANARPGFYNTGSSSGRTNSTKLQTNCTRMQTQAATPMKKVFITYANEDESHMRTIVQISQTLLRNSIEVTVDVLEQKEKAESVSKWLDKNLQKCDFVLICVSPKYYEIVLEDEPRQSDQQENNVNTRYIYRRIHNEYIHQGAINKRFIPVLVGTGKSSHVPGWLHDTKIFQWPDEYEDIIYRIFGQEKYIKPKPGQRPKYTIERYDSYSTKSAETTPKQI
ncbi:unnamed protein product [Clavelina lepadiformis]|uniref:SEFIR domain-containing protein n=1 Tax=Clavelina lepadiformis TaxID=159417 RepID=A0ABP0FEK9_CLALP